MGMYLVAEDANPLLPNATFFVELVIFVIVLFVLGRFVLPPIQKVLRERHELVQKTIEDNREASKRFDAAKAKHRETLTEARAESTRIRDEARSRGQAVLDEFRQRAQAEADDVRGAGERDLGEQRDRALGELHRTVGDLSGTLANRVVGAEVTGQQRIVDDYLSSTTGGGA